MTGILILLGMKGILWKILFKVMFAKKLEGQHFFPAQPCALHWPPSRAGQKKLIRPARQGREGRQGSPAL